MLCLSDQAPFRPGCAPKTKATAPLTSRQQLKDHRTFRKQASIRAFGLPTLPGVPHAHCTRPSTFGGGVQSQTQDHKLALTAPESTRRQFLLGSLGLPLLLGMQNAGSAQAVDAARPLNSAESEAVTSAFQKAASKEQAPLLLRLAFHDAATFSQQDSNGGANASLRFELERPENFGLERGWPIIEAVARALKGTPAETLSLADLVALGGAWAVQITGGPSIVIPVGRTDAPEEDPEERLPAETLPAAALRATFADKGLSNQELLGTKGFGDPVTFDNTYYQMLLKKPWKNPLVYMSSMIGLASDHVMADDWELQPFIKAYANDKALFFTDFAAAYIKMSCMGAGWA
ncbi:hypothetical protein WJX74_010134 [Apatococcus lobatus]|uniref:Plant heme peroxidase family profile domain-containing protein n=1 Tax=Apatococcus lobatus TaxID=904363 RepID=A0AAW1SGX1_9CHLO